MVWSAFGSECVERSRKKGKRRFAKKAKTPLARHVQQDLAHCRMGRLARVDCCFARDDGPRGEAAEEDEEGVAVEEVEAGEENFGEDSELSDEGRTSPAAAAAEDERSSAREEGPRGRSSRLSMAASSASSCCRKDDEYAAEWRAEVESSPRAACCSTSAWRAVKSIGEGVGDSRCRRRSVNEALRSRGVLERPLGAALEGAG